MKRLSIFGLMLASAFALTNCSQEIVPPIQENDVIVDESIKEDATPEEIVSIPFEVYANPSAETKTSHNPDNNGTKWSDKDEINVYHSVHGSNSYTNNHKFTIANVEKGLFGGGLASMLEADAYDWCFLYPYDSSRGNTLTNTTVTIGTDEQGRYIQTQLTADSKAHIAGPGCPMYGSTMDEYPNGIPAGENPKVRMKHLSALVAVKLVNETGNNIIINQIELESANNPIVGRFNVDLSGATPVFNVTPDGDENVENDKYSNSAILNLGAEGIQINGANEDNESFAKFYMAVAPVKDKFTIKINGTAITKDVEIPLESGKVTTLKVAIPMLKGTQEFGTEKEDGTKFITWDNKNTTAGTATINGQPNVQIKTVSDGTITISGTFDQFIGDVAENCALPLSFYAASKHSDSTPAGLKIKTMHVYCHLTADVWGKEYMNEELNRTFTGEALSEKIGNLPISFSLDPLGDFSTGNVVILKEVDSYYHLSEKKTNDILAGYLKKEGVEFVIQDIRDAIYKNNDSAWSNLIDAMQTLAPAQFGKSEPLGILLSCLKIPVVGPAVRKDVLDDIKAATLDVVLETTGDAICWGLNVQSTDTDPSATISQQ